MRQGCPLSAYLFILAVEILAIQIRSSNNIKGIQIADAEIKISQLADDTSLFIRDTESIKHIFSLLASFEMYAGLKANVEKTKFYNIGNTVINETKLQGPKFEKTPIQLLGITVTDDENISIEQNFTPRVKAIENILKHWSRRKLSLKGKITVINSLALSLIVYPASNLSTPNLILESLQSLFYEFLWDGKRPKIAAKTIENTISLGGLKMPNIFLKVQAWQTSWLRRAILNPTSNWLLILNKIIGTTTFPYLIHGNCSPDEKILNNIPNFYRTILKTWYSIKDKTENHVLDIPSQPLWFNKQITVDNKIMFKQTWYNHGILYIQDLLNNNGEFLSHSDVLEQLKIN